MDNIASSARSLSAGDDYPQLLAQLQDCQLVHRRMCTSMRQALPASCWSDKLCVEPQAQPNSSAPMLTSSGPFKHAFELLCNCILANSVDIVGALLPNVTCQRTLEAARSPVQRLLEAFLRCASATTHLLTPALP
jgi:hypothetical protein